MKYCIFAQKFEQKMSKEKLSVKQWADEDKPREKMLTKGIKALSSAELIAIVIGSGTNEESAVDLGKRILNHVNNSLTELSKYNVTELTKQFKGIGPAKAISILAALELGYRSHYEEPIMLNKIQLSQDAYKCIRTKIANLSYEEFWVLHLNNSNKIIHKQQVSSGGLTRTLVDHRMIFKVALERGSTKIILAHNHPSGNINPSKEDIALTKKIQTAANYFDINVLDHIIVCDSNEIKNAYYSFADEGIL
jgi:DNA repair protein RadC